MGKISKILGGTGIGTVLIAGTLYVLGPKACKVQYDSKKELIENLDKAPNLRYSHEDSETTQILDLISGKILPEDLHNLLKKYGYSEEEITANDLWPEDEAMYQAIRQLQIKYGNPKVAFKGDYKNYEELFKGMFQKHEGKTKKEKIFQHGRARYNPIQNKIKLMNLDSLNVSFRRDSSDIADQEIVYYSNSEGRLAPWKARAGTQRKLLTAWIAELSHAIQYQRSGATRMVVNSLVLDFVSSGFNYDDTYELPGTYEYDAHTILEPKLVQEFIEIYKQYVDQDDYLSAWNIAEFISGYFPRYYDEELSELRLTKCTQMGNFDAAFLLGKLEAGRYYKSLYFNIEGKSEASLDKALNRYEFCIDHGCRYTFPKDEIVELCRFGGYRLDEGITLCKELIEKEKDNKHKAKHLAILSDLYRQNNQMELAQEANEELRNLTL